MRDPYSVLGVRRNAGPDEIKAAWRTVVKTVHPDQNRNDPQASARFAEVGRAYEVLKDPKLRNRYDQARREADLRRMEEMARKTRGDEETVDPETAEEMISRLFGAEGKVRPAGQPAPAKPQPKTQPQAQAQAQKPETQNEPEPERETAAAQPAPAATAGLGVLLNFPRAAAPAAELVSAIVRRIRNGVSSPRPAADKVPDIFCEVSVTVADIFKREKVTATLPDGQTLKVALPAATTDGTVIRLKEQGYRLNGVSRGDLVVNVRVLQNGPFRTNGSDLHTTLDVSLHDAVLGGETTVETPVGKVPLSIPPWSGSDSVLTVAGHGLPLEGGRRGDLRVELRITLHGAPDDKLIDLMRSHRNGLVL